jgi:hypothetical protein
MAATRKCKRLRYNPAYPLHMIAELGAVGASRRLLDKAAVSEGFIHLRELGRSGLTVEAIVLRPGFAPPFTDEEKAETRQRLKQVGYQGYK